MRRAALALLLLAASDAAAAPPESCAPGWLSNPLLTNGILNGAIQEYQRWH